MLNERDQGVFQKFCGKVRASFPLARIYAYGSRVRGDHKADSDFDLCVVLPYFDSPSRGLISSIAWEVGFEHDLLISTVVFTVEQFDIFPGAAHPLVQAILQEGIAA